MSKQNAKTERSRPWLMRTYAGHSSAKASNELYRTNLAKGQTGLSVAFDLPTQTGYDSDDEMARGEVGKVGVPISHIEDMSTLFNEIPLDKMNTSMTINATAAWLLALYVAVAERQGVDSKLLSGTTQNDILKEYLSRGTYAFPPEPSMRLIGDTIAYTVDNIPKWNPINVCSYHLQEAGATPVQEIAFTMINAIAVLDAVRAQGVPDEKMPAVAGRISFFVNAGIRFVEEVCKVRAMTQMWDELTRERYGVEDPKLRRFRYGVQVNSLGLTESQPENNVQRIVLEMLGVVLSKDARARAIQLPAWNEALGLPRPWDQQWGLRIQQVMAYETDLLEYGDIFNGSTVIESKVEEMIAAAKDEIKRVEELGGAIPAVESGYMKQALVASNAARIRRIEAGEQIVVGVNEYTQTAESPLAAAADEAIFKVDADAERAQIEALKAHRTKRNNDEVATALKALQDAANSGDNIMPASIAAAHAGVTTGEWSHALRATFGDYRAPTGISISMPESPTVSLEQLREKVKSQQDKVGHPIKILVAKPGLDGHSNGAEQIAVRARDAGLEVIYQGIRLTPTQIVNAALQEDVDVVGLSILSGSHLALVPTVLKGIRDGGSDVPVVVGGIIPGDDAENLRNEGIARVYTPKDYDLNQIIGDLVELVN